MDNEAQQLTETLKKYNLAYRNGSPIVSDQIYDELTEKLRSIDPDNPYLDSVEPEVFPGKAKIKHETPMLSTEKSYSQAGLKKFTDRIMNAASEIHIPRDTVQFTATPKLDGIAGKFDGRSLFSRGDGLAGYDITNVFSKGVIPVGGKKIGVGEIVMQKSYYEEYLADRYDHPRNICQGIIAADLINPDFQRALDAEAVHFARYSELPSWSGNVFDLTTKIDDITKQLIAAVDYPLDGIVIEVANEKIKTHLGATSHHNRWQIAAKTKGEVAETIVTNIRYQVGRTGVHTPVLEFDEIYLSGANINKATAHHAGRIKDWKIGIGSKIEIIRSGEVIPKLERVIDAIGTPKIPTHCVDCGEALSWDNDFLKCTNLDCGAQVERKIEHWFKTLNVCDGFGPKTIQKIVDYGVRSLEEVYELTVPEFERMGLGSVQAQNLFNALKISRTSPLEDWRFLAAFGLPYLGRGDSRNLLEQFSFDDLIMIDDPAKIKAVHGFAEITSNSIVTHFKKQRDTIKYMMALGFNLERTQLNSEKKDINSPIAGKGIVFTGTMEQGNRNDMEEQARSLGASVQSAVTKKTDLLVCGSNVGAKKTGKAEDLGVKVISEEEYIDLLSETEDPEFRM